MRLKFSFFKQVIGSVWKDSSKNLRHKGIELRAGGQGPANGLQSNNLQEQSRNESLSEGGRPGMREGAWEESAGRLPVQASG